MKLTELQIKQFGIWRDLTLPLNESGISLLFGPNGTGKSTLLQSIHGTLFGFGPELHHKLPKSSPQNVSSLWFEQDGQLHAITRSTYAKHPAGQAELDGSQATEDVIAGFLNGVTPELWSGVYCMGLDELQELSALGGEKLTGQIYEASLGPDGRRILQARRLREQILADIDGPNGLKARVDSLLHRQRELTGQLSQLETLPFSQRLQERETLVGKTSRQEMALLQLDRRLRTGVLQVQIREPLVKLRLAQQELARLEQYGTLPEDGLDQLHHLEREIAKRRKQARHIGERLRQSRLQHDHSTLTPDEAAGINSIVSQRAWFSEVYRQLQNATARLELHSQMFQQERQEIAPDWGDEALLVFDQSAATGKLISDCGHQVHRTSTNLVRLRRVAKRMDLQLKRLKDDLADLRKTTPAKVAAHELETTVAQLHTVPRLAELNERKRQIEAQLERLAEMEPSDSPPPGSSRLPAWLSTIVAIFFLAAVVIGGCALVVGVSVSIYTSLACVLIATCCGGLGWGFKTHFERDQQQRVAKSESEIKALELEWEHVSQEILAVGANSDTEVPSTAFEEGVATLSCLKDQAHIEHQISHLIERREQLADRLEQVAGENLQAKSDWVDLLSRLGIEADADHAGQVESIVQRWHDLARLAQKLVINQELRERFETVAQMWRAVETDLDQLRLRIPVELGSPRGVFVEIDEWQERLETWQRQQHEQRLLTQQIETDRQRYRKLRRHLARLESRREDLLQRAGAKTTAEFQGLAQIEEERKRVRQDLASAQAELDRIGQESPEALALSQNLVSELTPVTPSEIDELRAERNRTADELHASQEQLAEFDLEIEMLLADTRLSDLHLEQQQTDDQLQAAVQQLAAVQLASDAIESQLRAFEKRSQPATLSTASALLSRMTCDRLRRVWTPLGERRMVVEDRDGISHPIEALSRGAKEQLYLSIRLAVIEQLADKGMKFPLLLDDVFVNFDQPRAEAAVDLLIEFSNRGHQVIFLTCHPHLVQLFKDRGIEPIRLHAFVSGQTGERLAG